MRSFFNSGFIFSPNKNSIFFMTKKRWEKFKPKLDGKVCPVSGEVYNRKTHKTLFKKCQTITYFRSFNFKNLMITKLKQPQLIGCPVTDDEWRNFESKEKKTANIENSFVTDL